MKTYHVCRTTSHKHAQSGFAIILVMGLLLVAAAITATILARQENETVWMPIENTKDQMEMVSKAIAAYERKNHRLPLPAARVQEGTLVLHREATSMVNEQYEVPSSVGKTLNAGATAYAGEGGIAYVSNDPSNLESIVLIGAIPTETLGLPQTAAEDSYGRLLTYAVTLASANPFTYEGSEGGISLEDNEGNEVASKLSYIVLAHGKEGAGAWNAKNRGQRRDCVAKGKSGGGKSGGGGEVSFEHTEGTEGVMGAGGNSSGPVSDSANCDEDNATFIIHDLTLVAGEGYFDDQLLRGQKDKIAQTISRPCAGSQLVTWGEGEFANGCSAVLPPPGLMHYGSVLEPREVVLTKSVGGSGGTVCEPGPSGPVCYSWTEYSVTEGQVTVSCDNGRLVLKNQTCSVPEEAKTTCTGDKNSPGGAIEYANGTCIACGAIYENCTQQHPNNMTCVNGTWQSIDGFCEDQGEKDSCTTPWGDKVDPGDQVQAYTRAGADSKDCAVTPANHTCMGTHFLPALQPWATATSDCGDEDDVVKNTCSTPWGALMSDGETVTAYQAASVACGGKHSCQATILTCNKGTLQGDTSYTHASCKVMCANCNLPWGGSIPHLSSVTAYSACDEGTKGGPSCQSTVHNCNDGSFDLPVVGSQSCSCKGGDGNDDQIGTIELGSDPSQACSQEGQCVECCVPGPGYECPATSTQCRCNSGTRVYDNTCGGGGGGGGPVM